ncbi:MAG: hypothetical protein LBI36_07180, partial [Oscillospiraceae bacterium]|nr:hypothetical protein [Oscillospiraceae bacterium]
DAVVNRQRRAVKEPLVLVKVIGMVGHGISPFIKTEATTNALSFCPSRKNSDGKILNLCRQ